MHYVVIILWSVLATKTDPLLLCFYEIIVFAEWGREAVCETDHQPH